MSNLLGKKTKIALTDYPYLKDIENRLFMADLSPFEVDLLLEILNSSLKIPISDLQQSLHCTQAKLITALKKISKTGLVAIQNDAVFVDKEKRKYFEFHIQKFDNDFTPGLDFLQGHLSKLPISLLPVWYNVPKTTDNIFASLIEKFFLTPKIYERYLREVVFGDEILDGIVQELFSADQFCLTCDDLKKKYHLSKEKLEEIILFLELHFVCALSYRKEANSWKGYITPLHEWHEFLLFQSKMLPKPIKAVKEIKRSSSEDFSFLFDFQKRLKKKPKSEDLLMLDGMSVDQFLALPLQDQAMCLYRQALAQYAHADDERYDEIERDFREVEKSLKKVLNLGWIYFDDFMKGLTCHVGQSEPVTLKKMGTKWKYVLPGYSEQDAKFVKLVIFDLLTRGGMIATGTHAGKSCFCVTAFGSIALGD